MNAVVIEDEAVASRRMIRLLEARDINVIDSFTSISGLSEYLADGERPDVFFMDIHLSDGIIFDLLNEVQIDEPIIFTTAYDQYAIKAFKQNSIDYLLKPIDEDELDASILKLKKRLGTGQEESLKKLLSVFMDNTPSTKKYRTRMSVKVGDKIRTFDMSEIKAFYSAQKNNFILSWDGRSYPIDHSIEDIAQELEPDDFFRVNRGHIVGIHFIKDVVVYTNARLKVILRDSEDHEIIVSRDRVKAFRQWLG